MKMSKSSQTCSICMENFAKGSEDLMQIKSLRNCRVDIYYIGSVEKTGSEWISAVRSADSIWNAILRVRKRMLGKSKTTPARSESDPPQISNAVLWRRDAVFLMLFINLSPTIFLFQYDNNFFLLVKLEYRMHKYRMKDEMTLLYELKKFIF